MGKEKEEKLSGCFGGSITLRNIRQRSYLGGGGGEGEKELCLLICSQDDKTLPGEYMDPGTLQRGPSRSLQRTLKGTDRQRKQIKAQQTG